MKLIDEKKFLADIEELSFRKPTKYPTRYMTKEGVKLILSKHLKDLPKKRTKPKNKMHCKDCSRFRDECCCDEYNQAIKDCEDK